MTREEYWKQRNDHPEVCSHHRRDGLVELLKDEDMNVMEMHTIMLDKHYTGIKTSEGYLVYPAEAHYTSEQIVRFFYN